MTFMNSAPRPAGSAAPPTRVAIIGSGFSGIAAAVALKRHGISDFTIFELSAGIGGTWWNNRYPGAEVDHTERGVPEDEAGGLGRIRRPDLVVQRGRRP